MKTAIIRCACAAAIMLFTTQAALADGEWLEAQAYFENTYMQYYCYELGDYSLANSLHGEFITQRAAMLNEASMSGQITPEAYAEIVSLATDAANRLCYISVVLNSSNSPPVWSVDEKLDDVYNILDTAHGLLYGQEDDNNPNFPEIYSKCDDCRDMCYMIDGVMIGLFDYDFPYVVGKLNAINNLLMGM